MWLVMKRNENVITLKCPDCDATCEITPSSIKKEIMGMIILKDGINLPSHCLDLDNDNIIIKKGNITYRQAINKPKPKEIKCPRCGSTEYHSGKRGWKLTTGFLGSSKIILTCLACGKKWSPGSQ